MFKHPSRAVFLATCAALTFSACASNNAYDPAPRYSGNNYNNNYNNSPRYYQDYGTISGVEYVQNNRGGNNNTNRAVGAVVGGALGGIAGHQIGKGHGKTAATIAGAVGGAMLGNAIAENSASGSGQPYWRVTVRLDGGGSRDFHYTSDPNVRVGERVRVEGDQLYR
ncbi:MAG: glycine zipper 2TM domain-containing protein [Rhodocyclaceae bacterium]|nr:glycine zipper 2TM domain-containing protein [Rhodocyclaceae bacterium]